LACGAAFRIGASYRAPANARRMIGRKKALTPATHRRCHRAEIALNGDCQTHRRCIAREHVTRQIPAGLSEPIDRHSQIHHGLQRDLLMTTLRTVRLPAIGMSLLSCGRLLRPLTLVMCLWSCSVGGPLNDMGHRRGPAIALRVDSQRAPRNSPRPGPPAYRLFFGALAALIGG